MTSVWAQNSQFKQRPKLSGDISTQVAVIGAGMAGILCAYYLKQAGAKVTVIEAAHIGSGQTQNTTAKITSSHNLIYAKLLTSLGVERATQYARANQEAVEEYARIVAENAVNCSFERCDNYVYSRTDAKAIEKEAAAASKVGLNCTFTTKTELPFRVAGAVKFTDQARFDPLKFLKFMSDGLDIYERTPALKILDGKIYTPYGVVHAEHIVIATHFPFINFPGFYFLRMHQERSYVLALKNIPKMQNMYIGADDGLSFRPYDDMLLFGGGSHRTGAKDSDGKYDMLTNNAMRFFPGCAEVTRWSAQDCMTLDGIPYIGQFSHKTPQMYVATGFGKWGMSTSLVAAKIITNAILGRINENADVFKPARFNLLMSVSNITKNSAYSAASLSSTAFYYPLKNATSIGRGKADIVNYRRKKIGVYKDYSGNVFAVNAKCPHLGCTLEWNTNEKSWDCPCHGSRFSYRGEVLDNPAQEGISIALE